MRPKKKTPDQRGLLLKERPFSYRARRDGTVEILWKGRRATTLAGKPFKASEIAEAVSTLL